MTIEINKLRQKRAELVTQARSHLDASEQRGANGIISNEDMTTYNRYLSDVQALGAQIDALESQVALERSIAGSLQDLETQSNKGDKDVIAVRKLFETGKTPAEFRNLQQDDLVQGGFTVLPEVFSNILIKFVDDEVFIRQYATIEKQIKAASLGILSLDSDMDDAEWTSELDTGSDDDGLAMGKRSLTPHNLVKRIKISEDLIANSTKPIMNLVAERLAYKFAVTQEKGFLTGSGAANRPLGVMTASNDGIPTSRDISTGNDATSIKFDGLFNAKFHLKGQHQRNSVWMFHRDAVKQICKLKDGNANYIWQPSVQMNQPDMLLGRPVLMSEFMPNTFTASQYVGIIGDFSHYYIAEQATVPVKILKELYAESNRIGVIGRMKVDGMPGLSEAFARVKLGA
jgi:HK97 family phage major capsid protein